MLEDLRSGKKTADKARNDQLCQPSNQSVIDLKRAEEGAVCKGMARAIRAHEEHHHAFCRASGFIKYSSMHGADRAQEEVEAYGAQIAVLRAEIAQLYWNCDYRPKNPGVTGFNITGTKCNGSGGEWKFKTQSDVGSHHTDGEVVVHLDKETLEGHITETYTTLDPRKTCISIMQGRAKFVDEELRIERLGLESFSDSCGSNWEPPSSLVTSTFLPLEAGEFCE